MVAQITKVKDGRALINIAGQSIKNTHNIIDKVDNIISNIPNDIKAADNLIKKGYNIGICNKLKDDYTQLLKDWDKVKDIVIEILGELETLNNGRELLEKGNNLVEGYISAKKNGEILEGYDINAPDNNFCLSDNLINEGYNVIKSSCDVITKLCDNAYIFCREIHERYNGMYSSFIKFKWENL